jgi:DNA modification methylase
MINYYTEEEFKNSNTTDNTVIHGDCLNVMPYIKDKSVDLIFADLPYGTTKISWDSVIPLDKLWEQYNRIIKDNGAILLFAQTPFDKVLGASNIKMLKYEWIWEKTQATGHLNAKKMPLKSHENILVFYKNKPIYNPQKTTGHKPINSYTKYISTQNNTEIYGEMKKEISGGGETDRYPRSVIKFPSDKQKSCLHPTQKPLALCEYLIKTYSNEGNLILDNTAGSGTTLLAAKNLNRSFIGIEKEEKYFQVIKNRLL